MIRVYIHGRPQGQDSWSAAPASNDKFYIQPFLESKIGEDMDAVLQVDLWKNNSYYSFVHRKNVKEKGNRPNAYFAITVCFEKQICTQVSTLYDLLDSVYSQLCLSNIIEKNGEQERFLISQFKEKEPVLNQITNIILQNIEKYIAGSLQPIEKPADTTSGQTKLYSTLDIDSPQFLSDCSTSRVIVSPFILSKERFAVSLKQQTEAAILERDKWRQEAEKEQQAKLQLAEEKRLLAEQNSSMSEQIRIAREALSEEKKKNESLQSEINKLKHQKKEPSHPRSPKPDKDHEADNPTPSVTEPIQSGSTQYQLSVIENLLYSIKGKLPVSFSLISFILGVLNTGLLITLLCIFSCHGCVIHKNETIPDYSSSRIDIMGYNGESPLSVDTEYGLQLIGVINEDTQDYSWEVHGVNANINANKFMVKESGKFTILCKDKNNKLVTQRTIEAK